MSISISVSTSLGWQALSILKLFFTPTSKQQHATALWVESWVGGRRSIVVVVRCVLKKFVGKGGLLGALGASNSMMLSIVCDQCARCVLCVLGLPVYGLCVCRATHGFFLPQVFGIFEFVAGATLRAGGMFVVITLCVSVCVNG